MKEFKEILRKEGITGKGFSKEIEISYSGYRSAVSRGIPTWVKAFLYGYKIRNK